MSTTAVGTAMLQVENLTASYGQVQVLRGVDFSVNENEVVVILGANGAGKTTTLRAICHMLTTGGRVDFEGKSIVKASTTEIVRRGIAHVPQGRGTFSDLTVEDNLLAGAYTRRDREVKADIERWLGVFPRLKERRSQIAGRMSGGEQQMLAVARALMARPRLVLLDEPSLGLAPIIVQDLFARLGRLNKEEGVTMLVVEQNANLAFDIADRAYVLEAGRIALSGTADELRNDDAVRRAYLGY